jgi:SpoVK/Ycf46/Vps4 family AAA+-type ATPase
MDAMSRKIEQTEVIKLLADIFAAGFDGNSKRLELLCLAAIKDTRTHAPEVATILSDLLSTRRSPFRSNKTVHLEAAPVDQDSSAPLVRVEKPERAPKPVFSPTIEKQLGRFFNEWKNSDALLSEGILPPRSLLLKGPPGTGKTMFAKWLAGELGLTLVTLDLATAISSYLGKTGMNLRRSLDYARANPCLLLLDEFDAVAKRRDDATEVGELKRIVNVLLKELENWPTHSLLIAATNHPELLDPAIARRFDRIFTMTLPEAAERASILQSSLGRFNADLNERLLKAICELLTGRSGSDLQTLGLAAVRRHIVEGERIESALISEMRPFFSIETKNAKTMGKVICGLKKGAGRAFTIREIAELTGLGPSTVHYHLQKG